MNDKLNDFDRNNLEFILNTPADELSDFWDGCDLEDIQYARELIERRKAEIDAEIVELQEQLLAEENFAEANAVLQQFRLQK